jgi:hypothetical protein
MLAGNDKDLRAKALDSANRPYTPPPTPPSSPAQTRTMSSPTVDTQPTVDAPVTAQVVVGFGGKPAPAPAPQPLI